MNTNIHLRLKLLLVNSKVLHGCYNKNENEVLELTDAFFSDDPSFRFNIRIRECDVVTLIRDRENDTERPFVRGFVSESSKLASKLTKNNMNESNNMNNLNSNLNSNNNGNNGNSNLNDDNGNNMNNNLNDSNNGNSDNGNSNMNSNNGNNINNNINNNNMNSNNMNSKNMNNMNSKNINNNNINNNEIKSEIKSDKENLETNNFSQKTEKDLPTYKNNPLHDIKHFKTDREIAGTFNYEESYQRKMREPKWSIDYTSVEFLSSTKQKTGDNSFNSDYLSYKSVEPYNQIKENERRFGIKPDYYDESMYTTTLDRQIEFYKKNIERAKRIEREILSEKEGRRSGRRKEGEERYSCVARDEKRGWRRKGAENSEMKNNDLKNNDLKNNDMKNNDMKNNDLKNNDMKNNNVKINDLKIITANNNDLKNNDMKINDLKINDMKINNGNKIIITNNNEKKDSTKITRENDSNRYPRNTSPRSSAISINKDNNYKRKETASDNQRKTSHKESPDSKNNKIKTHTSTTQRNTTPGQYKESSKIKEQDSDTRNNVKKSLSSEKNFQREKQHSPKINNDRRTSIGGYKGKSETGQINENRVRLRIGERDKSGMDKQNKEVTVNKFVDKKTFFKKDDDSAQSSERSYMRRGNRKNAKKHESRNEVKKGDELRNNKAGLEIKINKAGEEIKAYNKIGDELRNNKAGLEIKINKAGEEIKAYYKTGDELRNNKAGEEIKAYNQAGEEIRNNKAGESIKKAAESNLAPKIKNLNEKSPKKIDTKDEVILNTEKDDKSDKQETKLTKDEENKKVEYDYENSKSKQIWRAVKLEKRVYLSPPKKALPSVPIKSTVSTNTQYNTYKGNIRGNANPYLNGNRPLSGTSEKRITFFGPKEPEFSSFKDYISNTTSKFTGKKNDEGRWGYRGNYLDYTEDYRNVHYYKKK